MFEIAIDSRTMALLLLGKFYSALGGLENYQQMLGQQDNMQSDMAEFRVSDARATKNTYTCTNRAQCVGRSQGGFISSCSRMFGGGGQGMLFWRAIYFHSPLPDRHTLFGRDLIPCC